MLYVYDLSGNVERLTGHEASLERVDEVNGDRSIKFNVTMTEENAHAFDMLQNEHVLELPINGQQYRIKQMQREQQGKRIRKTVSAQHVFFDLIDEKTTREERKTGYFQIDPLLSFILAKGGWTFVIESGVFTGEQFENFGGENCLKSFNNLVDRFKFEYIPDSVTRKVHIYATIGGTTDAQIRYNHNLKTIKEEINSDALSTIGTAYGKVTTDEEGNVLSEITATFRHPNADIFGERWADDFEDERFTTTTSLRNEIAARIGGAAPVLSLEAEYIELKKNGINVHPFALGDDLFLIHEKWGLDFLARVLQITDYPYNPMKQPKITISNLRRNVKDKLASTTRRSIEAQKNALDAANKATLAELKANAAGDNAEAQKARLDAILDENGNMTTTSRLLYINSYVYADHQGLWAVDPQDPSRYAFHGAGGSDYHKGMIRITRPDGYEVMSDGILKNDFSLQPTVPSFRNKPTVVEQGVYWSTTETTPQNCEAFFFAHKSRYLKLLIVLHDVGTGKGSRLSVNRVGSGGALLGQAVTYGETDATATPNSITLDIDLGVPTGERYGVYVRLNTTDGGEARGRIVAIWCEG